MPEQKPVVLVTGASRGLGRGIALHVAETGCSVGINFANNEAAAKETVDLCKKRAPHSDQKFVALKADIASTKGREQLVEKTFGELGRLDALVNNAGIPPTVRADLTEMSEQSFDDVLATNLRGPHFLTQIVVRHWMKNPSPPLLDGGRKVIFISSVSAVMASVNRGEYCMSKAGLSMATKLWAARLASEGIQVFEVRPGIMATDMTSGVKQKYDAMIAAGDIPQRRWGDADDVGKAVKALLSNSFPFSTGSVINVDGGLSLERL